MSHILKKKSSRGKDHIWLIALIFCVLFVASLPARAEADPEAVPPAEATPSQSQPEDNATITDLLRRIETLEQEMRKLREAGPRDATIPATQPAPVVPEGADEARSYQEALERALVKRSGLLLPPRDEEVEFGLVYAHSSSDKIIIDGVLVEPVFVVGDIVSKNVRRDVLISSYTHRIGLPGDIQVDAYIPFRYTVERELIGGLEEETKGAAGLGDIEIGAAHQLAREDGWRPDVLAALRWKTRTGRGPFQSEGDPALGTGFHGFQFMLTPVKVRDPLAFFGSFSYTLNLSAFTPAGRVDPGDIVGLNLGMALALSPDASINFGWEQRFTGRTTLNGTGVPGSHLTVGNFRVGVTYAFTADVALDASISIGLTQDAPDMQALFSVPIRFPHAQ